MANSANVPGLRKLLQGELEGVALYRALAGIEARPELKEVYGRMAESEERHAARWRKQLVEAAKAVPSPYIDKGLGSVPVDFLSTCDITGGNSGSATLNGKGEIVGLAFDGNWEGVVSDFLFDPASVRTIHVDAVYIRWVMDEVDKAHNLLREMALPVHTPDH